MKIRLIWVGRTKEPFVREGIRKYVSLISPYASVEITELKDEKGRDAATCVKKEGERIVKLGIPYLLLDERGQQFDSPGFAGMIQRHLPNISFVLGGAYGVSDAVRQQARETVALSRMTFPHELSRVILLEQVYRGFTILHKKGYHH